MPSPSSASSKSSVNRLEKSGVNRELDHMKISIERLEKMFEALSDQYSPYVESLMDSAFNQGFEQGYDQGYNDGAEDVYTAKKESIDFRGDNHD